jgi:hypothetical protein
MNEQKLDTKDEFEIEEVIFEGQPTVSGDKIY